MSYNPSIFDDKISVTAQLEEVKKILDEGASGVTQSDLNALEQRIKVTTDSLEDDINLVDNTAKMAVSLTQNVAERALKTPTSAPTATQLVGVDTGNAQEMIEIGSGLALVENILYATGGGAGSGKYLHVIKFTVYNDEYLSAEHFGQLILLLNTSTNFTGNTLSSYGSNAPTYDQFTELGMAMSDAGYRTVSVLTHEDSYTSAFTSLSFRNDSGMLVVDTSAIDGESFGNDSFYNFFDTVIPL